MARVTYEYESCEKCDGKGEITYERQLDVDEFKEWVEACGDCEGTGEVAVKAFTEILVRVEDDLRTRARWPRFKKEEIAPDAVTFLKYGFKTNDLTDEGYIASVVEEPKPQVIEIPKEVPNALMG